MTNWLDEAPPIGWESFEEASEEGKSLLERLGGDRSLLRRLVFLAPERDDFYSKGGVSGDGGYLSIYDDQSRRLHVFLHVATGEHRGAAQKQRHSYVAKVLSGGYDHTWFNGSGQASYVTHEQVPGAYGMRRQLTHAVSWSEDALCLVMAEEVPSFAAAGYGSLDTETFERLRDVVDCRGVL